MGGLWGDHERPLLIVTLGKSETYKETIKEKSTILPYSIHKRIHVRPQRNLIQGIHVNTIQSTVLKEAAIRNSGLRHARAGPGSIRAKRRKESSGTPIIHDRSSLHTLHSPNQDGIPSLSESSTRYTLLVRVLYEFFLYCFFVRFRFT